MKRLIPLIEEFPTKTANVYEPRKYTWPKPDAWHWDWPQNPMSIAPGHRKCDLCDGKGSCNCITTCLPEITPRIMSEARKGQGARAIGISYVKDQILGELVGELVPLDTHYNGRAFEVMRPDLGEAVAQIYTGEVGNWGRKVNHSDDPSIAFRVMKISGCWRVMIVAIREIPHDTEITAFCGQRFLQGQE